MELLESGTLSIKLRATHGSSRQKSKKRSAVDFRRLNPWLKVIEYLFPVGEELIDGIPHGSRCGTHLDMEKAYNQQRVLVRHGCLTIRAPRSFTGPIQGATFRNQFCGCSV